MMLNYMQYIKETEDTLSGTTSDIKIKVEGKNSLVQTLIDNLSLVVKKRKLKSVRIKSITGYINRQTFTHHGNFYDTYLEVTLTNKDVIVGEYKSSSNSVLVRVNDDIVYDMDNRSFDNEVLIDKMVSEYIKYLKDKRFTINEAVDEKENGDKVYDFNSIIEHGHRIGASEQTLNDAIRRMLLNKNVTFWSLLDDDQVGSFEKTSIIKDVSYQYDMILVTTKNNMEGFIDLSKPVTVHPSFFKEGDALRGKKPVERVRWYHKGKLN